MRHWEIWAPRLIAALVAALLALIMRQAILLWREMMPEPWNPPIETAAPRVGAEK